MATKSLSGTLALAVTELPTPTAALAGLTVRLASDNKPYWCNGTTWVDLTAAGAGGTQEVFVQPTAPTPTGSPYLWIQTGLGADGTGFTFWVEDGL